MFTFEYLKNCNARQDRTHTHKKAKNKRKKNVYIYKKKHVYSNWQKRFDSEINDWTSWNNLALIWKSAAAVEANLFFSYLRHNAIYFQVIVSYL